MTVFVRLGIKGGSELSRAQWHEPDKLPCKAPRDLWRELDGDLWLAKAETA